MMHVLAITLAAFVAGSAVASLIPSKLAEDTRIAPAPNTALLRVATGFYDGVNSLLATGDATDLLSQLDAGFLSYSATTHNPASAPDLVAALQGIRSTFPDAHFAVIELDTRNDLVFAAIRISGRSNGTFAGMALDPVMPERLDEVLRIRDGKLVDRWGGDWSPAQFLNVANRIVSTPSGDSMVPELRQWRIVPNGHGDVAGESWRFLVVESGSIGWAISSDAVAAEYLSYADGRWDPVRARNRLEPGDAVVLPAGATARFWNSESAEARLLVVEVPLTKEPPVSSAGTSFGVTRVLLARGVTVPSDSRAVVVSIGQVSLPSSSSWQHAGIPIGGELLLVTGGSLDASVEGGPIWIVDEQSAISALHAAHVDAGRGIAIAGDAGITYRAAGTETMRAWVVTFMPFEVTL